MYITIGLKLFLSAIALLLLSTVFYQLGYPDIGEITVIFGTLDITISILYIIIKRFKIIKVIRFYYIDNFYKRRLKNE